MPVTISTIGSPQRITLKNDESVLNPNEISTRKSSKREPERERKSEKRQSQPPTIRNTQDFIQVPMGSLPPPRQFTRNSRQAQQKTAQNIQRAKAIPGKIKQDMIAFKNIHGPALMGVKESITSGLSQIGTIITTPFLY